MSLGTDLCTFLSPEAASIHVKKLQEFRQES